MPNNNNQKFDVQPKVVQTHCYKHNGKIHRIWEESMILEETEDYLICANNQTKVIENDGRSHYTKEPAIVFFYNIASPYLIDDDVIKYIDYDLDLRVFPDGGYRILDKNEYKYHKRIMNYSKELDMIINKELKKLIEMKNNNVGPFDRKVVDNYLKIYQNILN